MMNEPFDAIFPDPSILSWCEVSASALRDNMVDFKRRVGETVLLGAVVKSNAYGHGLPDCARIMHDAGADWLIVNSLAEATALREAQIDSPLYICGPISQAQASEVVRVRSRVVAYDRDVIEALSRAGRSAGCTVPIHLKLETGTHRQGVALDDLNSLARQVRDSVGIKLEGLTTHYADIEDTTNHAFAMAQLRSLKEAEETLRNNGFHIPIVHSANSAATILWPETYGNMVRVGIAAYGLWPSRETYATALQRAADIRGAYRLPELHPALSWRTRVTHINQVPSGNYVGYGRTFRATSPMRLAVLPVGYYEGYKRSLSDAAYVLIHGVRAPVRGRVCMNMCMVDVTHLPDVRVGDTATLIGTDGEERISAEQLAEWMGTISYEMVSAIHADQPRIVVNG